jgi:ectoine hydroxylase
MDLNIKDIAPGKARALSRARSDDRYPSRFEARPRLSRRLDPVIHGDAQGPLAAEALRHYEDRGWLSLETLLEPDDIARCLDELARLRADAALVDRPEAVVEPGSVELRSIFAVHQGSSAVLEALCLHPKLVAIARQLLGGGVYIHQSRINYKSGYRGQEFFWHSDFETWHVEDGLPAMRALSCSIALTENTLHNGPLMVIPGSHRRFLSCVGATPGEHYRASLKKQEIGVPDELSLAQLVEEYGIDAITGPAGTVSFFDSNLIHGSNSNITPQPRSNVFVVYNSLHNRPAAPFCGLAPRPNFIAEREEFRPC